MMFEGFFYGSRTTFGPLVPSSLYVVKDFLSFKVETIDLPRFFFSF
jgi:hypothetical protein